MRKIYIMLCLILLLSIPLTSCSTGASKGASADVETALERSSQQKTDETEKENTTAAAGEKILNQEQPKVGENSYVNVGETAARNESIKETSDKGEPDKGTSTNVDGDAAKDIMNGPAIDMPKETKETVQQKDNTVKQYDTALTGKYICLTFDDGPAGNNTPKVLKTLKKYGVKGTFFICGPDSPDRRKMIKQAYDEGHAIGIHCYSHRLKTLYKTEDSFFADFNKIEAMIKETTGSKPTLYRFPGGTNNGIISKKLSDTVIAKLKERGYEYYDWNASGKDDLRPSAATITKTALSYCKARAKSKTPTILLLHDSAGRYTSADALPGIIEQLKAKGFEFIPVSDKVTPVHLIKR